MAKLTYSLTIQTKKDYAQVLMQLFLMALGFVCFMFCYQYLEYLHYLLPSYIVFSVLIAPWLMCQYRQYFSIVSLTLNADGIRTSGHILRCLSEHVSKNWSAFNHVLIVKETEGNYLALVFSSDKDTQQRYELSLSTWDVYDVNELIKFIENKGLLIEEMLIKSQELPAFTQDMGSFAGKYAWLAVIFSCIAFLLRYLDDFFTLNINNVLIFSILLAPFLMLACFLHLKYLQKNQQIHTEGVNFSYLLIAFLVASSACILLYSVLLFISPTVAKYSNGTVLDTYSVTSKPSKPIVWQSQTSGHQVYCRFPALNKQPLTTKVTVNTIKIWGMVRVNRSQLCHK